MADPNNIILPAYKIAGFLLAKCGQTSIKTAFLRGLGVTRSLAYGAPGVAKLINGDTVFQYADKQTISELGPDWFKFTIVRNPWERAVSIWANKVYSPPDIMGIGFAGFQRGCSFDAFVKHLVKYTSPNEGSNIHWRGQAYSITVDGEIVPGFVGKMENLDEDWGVIQKECAARGLELPSLLQRNKTDHPGKTYTKRTKAMIAKHYAEDIKAFGYDF